MAFLSAVMLILYSELQPLDLYDNNKHKYHITHLQDKQDGFGYVERCPFR